MRFVLDDDALTIRFEGAEQFYAFKRKLVVPKADITLATWDARVLVPKIDLGLKMGGVGVPYILYAGQFMSAAGLNLLYVQKPGREGPNVVARNVLTLEIENSRYHTLMFTVTDPDIAGEIIAWWRS